MCIHTLYQIILQSVCVHDVGSWPCTRRHVQCIAKSHFCLLCQQVRRAWLESNVVVNGCMRSWPLSIWDMIHTWSHTKRPWGTAPATTTSAASTFKDHGAVQGAATKRSMLHGNTWELQHRIYFDERGTSWKQNLTRSYNIHLLIWAEIHTNRNQILKLKSSQQVLWPAQVPMAHWAPPKFSGCRWQQQVDTVPVCHSEFLQTLTCINTLNPITSYPHVQRSFDLPMHQAGSLSSFILLLRCVRRSILLLCAIVSSLNSTLRLFMAFPHNKWQMHEGFSNLLSQQCHATLLWNHRNRGFQAFEFRFSAGHEVHRKLCNSVTIQMFDRS